MTNEQRALIREHTRVCVHLLYCWYCIALGDGEIVEMTDARERYETARATYLARENRREAQHDER